MNMETPLQAQVLKFSNQAHVRMLIVGVVSGIAGFITVCFGMGLYHRRIKPDKEGATSLPGHGHYDDYEEEPAPVYETTFLGKTVLTIGIVIIIFALYCVGGGLLAKSLESVAKRKNVRQLRIIFFLWILLSLVTAGLLSVALFLTGNLQPVLLVIITCGLVVSLWRICIIWQFSTECKNNDYKY